MYTEEKADASAWVDVKSVSKSFGSLAVLRNVSFSIAKGSLACIVGPSGAGKSTLLQIVGSLLRPDAGEVRVGDVNVQQLQGKALSSYRNQSIGFVFQFHNLLPEFTAWENVCLPALIAGVSMPYARERAEELLESIGLKERMQHRPGELSGGEQQRVAVARALMNNPGVILADEPTGNLDSVHRKELLELFLHLREHYAQTFLIVTHDDALAQRADTVIHLLDGKINPSE